MEPEGGLRADEEVKSLEHPSPWSYTPFYLTGIVLLPVYLIGIFVLLGAELHRRGNKYFITDKRVIREFKFINVDHQEASFDLLSDISINQSLKDRILGIGDVEISTASAELIKFRNLKKPGETRSVITNQKAGNEQKQDSSEAKQKQDSPNTDQKYCSECGEEVSENDKYCSQCGEKLE